MRPVQTLSLSNFRGFVGEHHINLDADLVLIAGKNGVGKTSIMFALNLLLNGQTSMLEKQGRLLTEGAQHGSVTSRGMLNRSLDLNSTHAPVLFADLLERAHFFFSDWLDSPESSNDVMTILEPKSSAWDEIKPALEGALHEITHRRKMHSERVANVDSARRSAARRFESARLALPSGSFDWVELIRDAQSLLLAQDNLANHWESQLRNLVAALGGIVGTSSTPSAGIASTLTDFADGLKALRDSTEEAPSESKSKRSVVSALANRLMFPEASTFKWSETGPSEAWARDSAVIFPISDEAEKNWIERIGQYQEEMRKLERRLREIDAFINGPGSPIESIESFLRQMSEGGPQWLSQIERFGQSKNESIEALRSWIDDTAEKAPGVSAGLRRCASLATDERLSIADRLRDVGEIETRLQHEVSCAQVLRLLKDDDWVRSASSIGELKEFVHDFLNHQRSKTSTAENVMTQLASLEDAARAWAGTERDIEAEVLRAKEAASAKEFDKTLADAERTIKKAMAGDGIFSLAQEISGPQLEKLLKTLNQLLSRFHFPKDFLPISLKRSPGRGKSAMTYRFVSRNGVAYQGLSAGQKTQLALCWSVCLSYALRERLEVPIIAFDDFTTALDQGQLIPAAGILRQLAYSNSTQYARQVVVTSHHEEMTNRLIEYLLPPPGKKMRVIQFDEWTVGKGPAMSEYNAKMSHDSNVLESLELCQWLRTQLHARAP